MNLSWIVVFISALALLTVVFLLLKSRASATNLEELRAKLRPIDVNAFFNLIDENEQQYLRERLPTSEFRSIDRERALATIQYVWAAAQNARILNRLGEAAMHDSNPEVVKFARNVQKNALLVQIFAVQAMPRLLLSTIVPGLHWSPNSVASTYETVGRQAVMLRVSHPQPMQSAGS